MLPCVLAFTESVVSILRYVQCLRHSSPPFSILSLMICDLVFRTREKTASALLRDVLS